MTTPSQPAPQQWFQGPTPPPYGPQWSGPVPPAWNTPNSYPPPRPPRRKVWPWVAAGVLALLFVLGTAVGVALNAATVDLRGDVMGTSPLLSETTYSGGGSFYPTGGECAGHGEFSDIRGGAVVTVFDSDGQVAGTGQLGSGVGTYGLCTFPFAVAGLPTSDFYRVQVSGRPPVTWTLDEVMGENGIRLTVGS